MRSIRSADPQAILIVFAMIFNFIVWIAINAALAVRYQSWAFAIGCLVAWWVSATLVKLGKMGKLPLLSWLERFLLKHPFGASTLLYLLCFALILAKYFNPEVVQEEMAASGRSRFWFWFQPGLLSGLLGGHAFFIMSQWIIDQAGIPETPRPWDQG